MNQLSLWTVKEKAKVEDEERSLGYYCANECGDFTHNPSYICDDCKTRKRIRKHRYQ